MVEIRLFLHRRVRRVQIWHAKRIDCTPLPEKNTSSKASLGVRVLVGLRVWLEWLVIRLTWKRSCFFAFFFGVIISLWHFWVNFRSFMWCLRSEKKRFFTVDDMQRQSSKHCPCNAYCNNAFSKCTYIWYDEIFCIDILLFVWMRFYMNENMSMPDSAPPPKVKGIPSS